MKWTQARHMLQSYVLRHWFKLALIAILLFVFFKKDFTMQVRVQAPVTAPATISRPAETTDETVGSEVLTQAEMGPSQAVHDRFELRLPGFQQEPPLANPLSGVDEANCQAFVERFARVAVMEQQRYGVPSSITLAIGLLQSKAGQSAVLSQTNNYFLLPCTEEWIGDRYEVDGSCLRVYDVAWTSFRDHSLYLSTGPYRSQLPFGDTKASTWAKAVAIQLYPERREMAAHIMYLIKTYALDQYDKAV